MSRFRLATFQGEITPPLGHPLCGGWREDPAVAITDPLRGKGVILMDQDRHQAPVVLCALDWCEISHADHLLWRTKLAEAVGTTPERVAVQCLHTHEAPWPDREAYRLTTAHCPSIRTMDLDFCDGAIDRVATAAREALVQSSPASHFGVGEARVEQVASNRRLLGPDGKINAIRWTTTTNPAIRAEPEGLIDPMLKVLSFWNGDKKIAALHYYATHPNGPWRRGEVTKDFAGLAREARQAEDDGAMHLYFTGCAGNITAGKYNDGAPENRQILAGRLHKAMTEAECVTVKEPLESFRWRHTPLFLPAREDFNEKTLVKAIANEAEKPVHRIRAAMMLSYLRQTERRETIPLTCLELGNRVRVLHLPGEPFIEYQLFAQEQRRDSFVAVAGYGDCSVGYIPLAISYEEGGYEPEDAFVSAKSEDILKNAIAGLLADEDHGR